MGEEEEKTKNRSVTELINDYIFIKRQKCIPSGLIFYLFLLNLAETNGFSFLNFSNNNSIESVLCTILDFITASSPLKRKLEAKKRWLLIYYVVPSLGPMEALI